MPNWVGRTLGKSSVELLLARDEAYEVYLGRHRGLQRAVAIKIFNGVAADDATVFSDFQLDVRSLAALQHPHIAQVVESGRADGSPYLILEYVPGISVRSHLMALSASQRKFEQWAISRLLAHAADGLDFAHTRGLIHRELRPSSILLTSASAPVEAGKPLPPDFSAVLTDFALAPQHKSRTPGLTAATAAYMSPEQARGDSVDRRTDVYSLGVILFELLAGHPPFVADSATAVLKMHQEQQPPILESLGQPIQDVLERALHKDPAARFASATELAAAFEAALSAPSLTDSETAAAAASPSSRTTPQRQPRLRSWVSTAVVGGAVLVLATILGARALIGSGRSTSTSPESAMESTSPSAQAAVAETGDPIGILRFQDGAALVDEVSFNASGMPPLDLGHQYEVWLLDASGEERRSVGYLELDSDGSGTASLVDPEGRNLLGQYQSLEVTVEPRPDPSPNPDGAARFAAALPEEGLLHVRHLLVSFSRAPNAIGLLDGLVADSALMADTARSMLASYEAGDAGGTRSEAEAMLNMLVGSQSPDYADWDSDGQVEDPSDGFGLLLNGENSGYIQGSIAHAGFAASSASATSNMQSHGDHVIVSARNLEVWAPQLRDLLKQVLASPSDPALGGMIRQAVALSENVLAGTDLNGNERVEAIAGEGGAETAYQHALYMADIVITQP